MSSQKRPLYFSEAYPKQMLSGVGRSDFFLVKKDIISVLRIEAVRFSLPQEQYVVATATSLGRYKC
jgi:hypothetical protein